MADAPDPVVMVVDDERQLADLYVKWLDDEYDARGVYEGEDALDALDESIDVVLLDRRMPGLSGDAVLERIRERNLTCRVAMVTAVEPGFDIVEMGFDDYLVKPVTRDELRETVERLLRRSEYDREVRNFFATASKKAVLESQKSAAELASNAEYAELESEFVTTRKDVETLLEEMTADDFEALLGEIDDSRSNGSAVDDG